MSRWGLFTPSVNRISLYLAPILAKNDQILKKMHFFSHKRPTRQIKFYIPPIALK
jgi:hypothetical protein